MSIRVINKKPDKSAVKRIVCENCGVTLEYLPIDVKERHGTDYGGGPDGAKWIDCPECKKTVTIERW